MRLFEHKKIDVLNYNLTTTYGLGKRLYRTPEGNVYPSVSSVLADFNKEAILAWRARVGEEEANRVCKVSSTRGTKFHSLCEDYLLNQLSEEKLEQAEPSSKQIFDAVKKAIDKSLGKIYCLEQALYSDRLRIAGRVDCIADWDGVPSIIDFKNSAKPKREDWVTGYFMQCTCYSCMFSERTSLPVNQIVLVIGVVDHEEPQVYVRKTTDFLDQTIGFIRDYHKKN